MDMETKGAVHAAHLAEFFTDVRDSDRAEFIESVRG